MDPLQVSDHLAYDDSIMIPATDQTDTGTFIEYGDALGDYYLPVAIIARSDGGTASAVFGQTDITEATSDEIVEVLNPPPAEFQNAGGSQKKTRKTKLKDITFSDLQGHFGKKPLKELAKDLGVCRTTLKAHCRKLGIPGWPFKKRNATTVRTRSTTYT